ncbi:RBBP8 N-terminal-like protein isoform X2 [Salarias fasciatus]|uniref:RBBP8 N-terminal-like protein isoform X2 n=1 Tax=Salarias fasciatus TaxID=181472 RepID=UPI0011767416|nr:RBBP8 N-terminal-like protein isoform X2 [Salarias fasciatus]
MMECFNELLLKLREVHEREVEGWQVKVQELSNKKGCDSKRMEELFTRNQQMKEQQRLLTENIKTLENRLRAGLCDRCTVTQEVAKRRQQEFEASQIQSLQHISLLATEMNNMKKENKKLKEDIRNLKAALDMTGSWSRSQLTAGESRPHLNSRGAEVKVHSSPDSSPSSGPMALRTGEHPADADVVAVKTEAEPRPDEAEGRQLRPSRSHFDQYKSLLVPGVPIPSPWKTERSPTRAVERRVPGVEALDQRSSIPSQVLLRSSSSSMSGEMKPSRHVLHVPVPCHPQPIKSSPVSLPWALPEPSEWGSLAPAGTSSTIPPSPRLNLARFNNLISNNQHVAPRRPVFNQSWQKHSTPQPSAKEPTVVFRLSSLPDYVESQRMALEKKENLSSKTESVSEEGLKEACDAPLDLSDRGKSKSSQAPRVQKSPDIVVNASSNTPVSSPSPVVQYSSSCSPPAKQEQDSSSDQNHKVDTEQEQNEEVNGKTDQSNEKKVPALTISLRPVVLETLNSALQKQEALSSNGKSSPGDEPISSTDEPDEESGSGPESSQGCRRKRTAVETDTDVDSDPSNVHQEKKPKSVSRAEKSPR